MCSKFFMEENYKVCDYDYLMGEYCGVVYCLCNL